MASKQLVESLYEALARRNTEKVADMMAEDVEWWFHGPRRCQYMRQLLTGEVCVHQDFRFRPRTVTDVGGGWVVAEGWEGKHAYWVHAWMVEGGIITRFREYFNTAVTVHEVGDSSKPAALNGCAAARKSGDGSALWESTARTYQGQGRSLPGLVLAI